MIDSITEKNKSFVISLSQGKGKEQQCLFHFIWVLVFDFLRKIFPHQVLEFLGFADIFKYPVEL